MRPDLHAYITARREELTAEQKKTADAMVAGGGLPSPRAAQFLGDYRTRALVLDELERLARWDRANPPYVVETPEDGAKRVTTRRRA